MTRALGLGSLTRAYGEPLRQPVGAPRIMDRPIPDFGPDTPCQDGRYDPEWWFIVPPTAAEPSHEQTRANLAKLQRAKTLCGTCHAVNECAAWALTYGEDHGVWGGLDPVERSLLQRHRRRFPRRT